MLLAQPAKGTDGKSLEQEAYITTTIIIIIVIIIITIIILQLRILLNLPSKDVFSHFEHL